MPWNWSLLPPCHSFPLHRAITRQVTETVRGLLWSAQCRQWPRLTRAACPNRGRITHNVLYRHSVGNRSGKLPVSWRKCVTTTEFKYFWYIVCHLSQGPWLVNWFSCWNKFRDLVLYFQRTLRVPWELWLWCHTDITVGDHIPVRMYKCLWTAY
jgi:hypothetical protein